MYLIQPTMVSLLYQFLFSAPGMKKLNLSWSLFGRTNISMIKTCGFVNIALGISAFYFQSFKDTINLRYLDKKWGSN